MSTRTIQFNNMHITEIHYHKDGIDINFDDAIIVKNMDAAEQDTRWYGAGAIRVEAIADDDFETPECPVVLVGADVRNNQMIYRDEAAIPFNFHGHVGIDLRFPGKTRPVSIYGKRLSLELRGHEKYIEHIKA